MAYRIKNTHLKEKETFSVDTPKGTFKIDDKIMIVCKSERTRNGFRHRATLFIDGIEREHATIPYQNRTWERYEFESVMNKLVEKSAYLNPQEKQSAKEWLKGDRTDWSDFKRTQQIASLGDVFGQTLEEKNAWKVRMLKAGLGNKGLDIPEDFDKLSEAEKKKRLDKVMNVLKEH